MDQQTFNVSGDVNRVLVRVHGNLSLNGSDQTGVAADGGDPDTLNIREVGNVLYVTCLDDCAIRLPAHYPTEIEKVGGDASCGGMTAPLSIGKVGGDLYVSQASTLSIEKVGGDCSIRRVDGDLSINKIGGDFRAVDLMGSTLLDKISGDCEIQQLGKEASLRADGNVEVGIASTEASYTIHSGGDLTLHLPSGVEPNLQIRAGGDILLQYGGRDEVIEKNRFQVSSGSRLNLSLDAGGDVRVTESPWTVEVEDSMDEEETHRSYSFTFDSQKFAEKMSRHAESAARNAEKRVQEAMRRVDSKMRSKGQSWTWGEPFTAPEPPEPPEPPFDPESVYQSAGEPVTDDERLLILRMIQEKKITVEEAEKLLEAMEGQEQ